MIRTSSSRAIDRRSPRSPALATAAAGRADKLGKETSIPFVGTIGIYDFEADSDRGVYLQDQQRRWYYARISGVCTGLPFSTPDRGRHAVRRQSARPHRHRCWSIGQRCHIDSLTASNGAADEGEEAPRRADPRARAG